MEGQLKKTDGKSILPGGYCSVDYHFQPWIHVHGFAGLTLDKHPLVKKWYEDITKDKNVVAAYKKIDEAVAAEQAK